MAYGNVSYESTSPNYCNQTLLLTFSIVIGLSDVLWTIGIGKYDVLYTVCTYFIVLYVVLYSIRGIVIGKYDVLWGMLIGKYDVTWGIVIGKYDVLWSIVRVRKWGFPK